MSEAFVTLATNDEYCKGAAVVAKSLIKAKTNKKLVCLISPYVTEEAVKSLSLLFDELVTVDVLDSKDETHLAMLKRPELGITFTKIHCWNLTQYEKCVFMDADTMVVENVDEMFGLEELSAVPDCGWPDMFNSGVFVYKPCSETYKNLIELAKTEGSFDGGDQGLLNTYFTKWNRISFKYNMQATTSYTYTPAFAKFGDSTKIVHFLGEDKPWKTSSSKNTNVKFTQQWWNLYQDLPQKFQEMSVSGSSQQTNSPYDEVSHFNMLRQGKVDVKGSDKFDNIQKKIDDQINRKDK